MAIRYGAELRLPAAAHLCVENISLCSTFGTEHRLLFATWIAIQRRANNAVGH